MSSEEGAETPEEADLLQLVSLETKHLYDDIGVVVTDTVVRHFRGADHEWQVTATKGRDDEYWFVDVKKRRWVGHAETTLMAVSEVDMRALVFEADR